jgi:periplasmic mercuric ion binding protein
MKRLVIFITIIISSFSLFAQDSDIKTETFKVQGNCGMCKQRIEDAAYVKGVKRAEWNKDTKVLTVTYKPSKATSESILQSVAKVGHSSEKVTASEKSYKKLPDCCQYKTNVCND